MGKKVDKSAPKNEDKRYLMIANKLRKLREATGSTSAETFANENEINRVQYWRMEKGSNITMKSLLKVLDIHKVTLAEFFSDIK